MGSLGVGTGKTKTPKTLLPWMRPNLQGDFSDVVCNEKFHFLQSQDSEQKAVIRCYSQKEEENENICTELEVRENRSTGGLREAYHEV